MTPEALARHLRHNRGVRIDQYRTIVPEGWTPHPATARKLCVPASPRAYAKALREWRKKLHVSSALTFAV